MIQTTMLKTYKLNDDVVPYLEQIKWVQNLLHEKLKHILGRYLDVAFAKKCPLFPLF